ncbi:MAG: glycerol-3-phosphate 1-O-acyltransferase PlsY [Ruminiclostridium sp.]|nr:glycerol-3-phosphate 1-O-acyltransferase PlsY [Ruminiclostridium sp.]
MSVFFIFGAIAGYLLGSLNSSMIVGKFYGTDIRKHGSGNAGTTNALRILGKKAALLVLAGDFLKGILAYLIGFYLTGSATGGMIAGTASVLGHIWPVFFGFRGGKGVLTSLAVLLMADWSVALAMRGLFIIVVAITRYISLGSIIAAVLFPLTSLYLGRDIEYIIVSAIIGILIVIMHRTNIKRLLAGTESKLGAKKQKDDKQKDDKQKDDKQEGGNA